MAAPESAAAAPYLGREVSPHGRPPDFECGVAPLDPPAPAQPLTLDVGLFLSAASTCSRIAEAWLGEF